VILNIIIFIFVLGVLVFIHEFGHFIAAKKAGMLVDEFGIGYPPKVFSKKYKETTYSVNLLPLGGFVKIKGEQYDEEADDKKDKRLFYNRPLSARLVVVIAGVIMNFLFGIVVLWIGFCFGFPSLTRDMSKVKGAQVLKQDVIIADVYKDSPAAKSKIKPGTTLVSSGDFQFKTVLDVQQFTKKHLGQKVDLTLRDSKNNENQVALTLSSDPKMPLGVSIISDNIVKFSPLQAGWESLKESFYISKMTGQAIIDLLKDLFTHGKISENISGPVGIYQATAQAADVGFSAVLLIAIILSINLALINLVPFPALDGGKLIFLVIEAIFRKRVIAVHIEQAIETVGFFLLILFILAVTYKDIIRIG